MKAKKKAAAEIALSEKAAAGSVSPVHARGAEHTEPVASGGAGAKAAHHSVHFAVAAPPPWSAGMGEAQPRPWEEGQEEWTIP